MKKYNFKFVIFYILTLLIISLISGWCFLNFNKPTFVVVNTEQVLRSSSLGKQEHDRINAVVDVVRQSEQKAEDLYVSLSADEARERRMIDQQILRQVIENNSQLARQMVMLEVNKAVKKVIAENNYPVAVDSSLALTNDQSNDITNQIIKELSATEVNFGPLPEIKVNMSIED